MIRREPCGPVRDQIGHIAGHVAELVDVTDDIHRSPERGLREPRHRRLAPRAAGRSTFEDCGPVARGRAEADLAIEEQHQQRPADCLVRREQVRRHVETNERPEAVNAQSDAFPPRNDAGRNWYGETSSPSSDDASGDAFAGDWLAAGVQQVSVSFFQDTGVDLTVFLRIATSFDFPGAAFDHPTIVPSGGRSWSSTSTRTAPSAPGSR